MNKVTYKISLKLIEELINKDPSPSSKEGRLLILLGKMVQSYESGYGGYAKKPVVKNNKKKVVTKKKK